MAKPELGTKRLCASCGAKFYDLNKDPIHCPKCGTVYVVAPVVTRGRPEPAAVVRPAPAEEVVKPEPQEIETVSLEEADAEASGAKKPCAARQRCCRGCKSRARSACSGTIRTNCRAACSNA